MSKLLNTRKRSIVHRVDCSAEDLCNRTCYLAVLRRIGVLVRMHSGLGFVSIRCHRAGVRMSRPEHACKSSTPVTRFHGAMFDAIRQC